MVIFIQARIIWRQHDGEYGGNTFSEGAAAGVAKYGISGGRCDDQDNTRPRVVTSMKASELGRSKDRGC